MLPCKRQHLVPDEHVVALPVRQQVGVLHRAEADHARDLAPLCFGKFGILLGDDLAKARSSASSSRSAELHGVAAAGLEGLAVLAKNFAETDVAELDSLRGFRLPAREGQEELPEVRRCRSSMT